MDHRVDLERIQLPGVEPLQRLFDVTDQLAQPRLVIRGHLLTSRLPLRLRSHATTLPAMTARHRLDLEHRLDAGRGNHGFPSRVVEAGGSRATEMSWRGSRSGSGIGVGGAGRGPDPIRACVVEGAVTSSGIRVRIRVSHRL